MAKINQEVAVAYFLLFRLSYISAFATKYFLFNWNFSCCYWRFQSNIMLMIWIRRKVTTKKYYFPTIFPFLTEMKVWMRKTVQNFQENDFHQSFAQFCIKKDTKTMLQKNAFVMRVKAWFWVNEKILVPKIWRQIWERDNFVQVFGEKYARAQIEEKADLVHGSALPNIQSMVHYRTASSRCRLK